MSKNVFHNLGVESHSHFKSFHSMSASLSLYHTLSIVFSVNLSLSLTYLSEEGNSSNFCAEHRAILSCISDRWGETSWEMSSWTFPFNSGTNTSRIPQLQNICESHYLIPTWSGKTPNEGYEWTANFKLWSLNALHSHSVHKRSILVTFSQKHTLLANSSTNLSQDLMRRNM